MICILAGANLLILRSNRIFINSLGPRAPIAFKISPIDDFKIKMAVAKPPYPILTIKTGHVRAKMTFSRIKMPPVNARKGISGIKMGHVWTKMQISDVKMGAVSAQKGVSNIKTTPVNSRKPVAEPANVVFGKKSSF